ncbi:MAG: ABC-2 family transporter protein [candidate division Zixibacteria bacterium]|nr:ABC-2 family transporter protein [candidate division Zixibacteria bacterium]
MDNTHSGDSSLARSVRLFGRYQATNLSAGIEYRAAFLTQVFAMIVNNSAFIIFWLILFDRVGTIKGYDFTAVMFLWALAATGFGIAAVFFGNSSHLSQIIYNGELDVYLLQPKPVLLNVLISRSHVSGWGDLAYGLILFFATQPISIGGLLLFMLFSIMFAAILISLRVLYHSMTFFLGNAEELATRASDMVISFALYPGTLFDGPVVLLLYSLVPAALAAWIPFEIFQSFDANQLAILICADLLVVGIAYGVFCLGLRSYESGNRMGVRL